MEADVATTATPKRKRRWHQFSLRTLLLFTVTFAIACGLLGRKIDRKRREREAVEAIRTLSFAASVKYDYNEPAGGKPPGPAWLRKLLGDNFFSEVEDVSLSNMQHDDEGMQNLEGLPRLRRLWLGNSNVTDVGIQSISCLTDLEQLDLCGTLISDNGLANVKALTKLQDLNLGNTKISDAGLQNLEGLANLRHLNLSWTYITDAGLLHLKQLANLQELWLSNSQVTDSGVKELLHALPNCTINR